MSFTILLLSADADPSWPEKISRAVPGAVAKIYTDPTDALDDIETADAAYGTVPPELFARAKRLRWICASRAGLGAAYFYDALVKSDVVVTGMHGSYNEHLSTHAVAFLLAFARRFEHYLPLKRWQRGPGMIDLPTQTVLIVGVGGAGSEASKQCAAFGMRVLGIDPRVTEPPAGMAELSTPDRLEERLGEADFIIVTTPETPDTLGMFNARLFSRMKRGAYFINIARPLCRHARPDRGSAVRPARGCRPRCRRSGAAAARQPVMGHAQCADHAACRNPRHPLSSEMGSDPSRKLPALRRWSAAAQRRRQGKMVLTAD